MIRGRSLCWLTAMVPVVVWPQAQLDSNGDGGVSLEEMQAFRAGVAARRFDAADLDGDGLLSADELEAVRRGHRSWPLRDIPAELDIDRDGSVSLPELQARRPDVDAAQYNAADADGDGLLGREELRDLLSGRPGWAALDADADGKLSLAELRSAHPEVTEEQFGRLDRNGDGLLDRAERRPLRPGAIAEKGPRSFRGRPPRTTRPDRGAHRGSSGASARARR